MMILMNILQWKFLHPRFWPSWLGLLLMRITVFLPVKIQLLLGNVLGALMGTFMRRRVNIAERNLALCFPELSKEQRAVLLKKNMEAMGMLLIETALSWWSSDKKLLKRVRYVGLEHLEQALNRGKGVIVVTGHYTSMEIGGRLLGLKNPGYVFFRPMKNLLLNEVMMAARKRNSEGVILRDDPRAMLRLLRQGKAVWYAPDQDFGQKLSIFATFFGVQAATIPSTGKMAKMSGAAIVPFVPKRELDGSYTLTCSPALTDYPQGDDIKDAQRINDVIEAEVRKMPEQYFWIHRRFKTQPEGKKGQLYNS